MSCLYFCLSAPQINLPALHNSLPRPLALPSIKSAEIPNREEKSHAYNGGNNCEEPHEEKPGQAPFRAAELGNGDECLRDCKCFRRFDVFLKAVLHPAIGHL